MRALSALLCAIISASCSDGSSAEDPPDFGAGMAARQLVTAHRACIEAGIEDIESCADSPIQNVRRSAKTAIEMQRVFSISCAGDLGRQRCDDMFASAYYSAASK